MLSHFVRLPAETGAVRPKQNRVVLMGSQFAPSHHVTVATRGQSVISTYINVTNSVAVQNDK